MLKDTPTPAKGMHERCYAEVMASLERSSLDLDGVHIAPSVNLPAAKRAKKDPNAPKNATSAFIFYGNALF